MTDQEAAVLAIDIGTEILDLSVDLGNMDDIGIVEDVDLQTLVDMADKYRDKAVKFLKRAQAEDPGVDWSEYYQRLDELFPPGWQQI